MDGRPRLLREKKLFDAYFNPIFHKTECILRTKITKIKTTRENVQLRCKTCKKCVKKEYFFKHVPLLVIKFIQYEYTQY